MPNPKKIKMLALKLTLLSGSDQQWVLHRLPSDISSLLETELATLLKFGLENPAVIIEQMEK